MWLERLFNWLSGGFRMVLKCFSENFIHQNKSTLTLPVQVQAPKPVTKASLYCSVGQRLLWAAALETAFKRGYTADCRPLHEIPIPEYLCFRCSVTTSHELSTSVTATTTLRTLSLFYRGESCLRDVQWFVQSLTAKNERTRIWTQVN